MTSFCFYRQPPTINLSSEMLPFSRLSGSCRFSLLNRVAKNHVRLSSQPTSNSFLIPGLRGGVDASTPRLSRGIIVSKSSFGLVGNLTFSEKDNSVNGEPFRGKSGSISFRGSTHQSVEESKTMSTPLKQNAGTLVWFLAPLSLISSLILPQLCFGFITDGLLQNEVLSEIVGLFLSEVMFYIGVSTFLRVTDLVQKPYLQYSSKRWSLITGLRGYLTCSFFIMGFKVFAPLLAVYVTWPVLGLPAIVAVAPFLAGCLVQFGFERTLDRRGSSCWPLVPIIFEAYRLYQLTKAAHFLEKLMYAMRGTPVSPEILDRHGALVAMVVTFQVLGLICLWSLLTFLMRLFPSRPVAENY